MSTMTMPSTVAAVFAAAADRLQVNGHHVGDFVPGALSVPDSQVPLASRPLSVAAAIQLESTGTPLGTCALSRWALWLLADHVAEVTVHPDDEFDAYTQLGAWEELVPDGAVVATLRDLAGRGVTR
jgi:hypothetical protein